MIKAKRTWLGHAYEGALIVLGLWLLWQHPLTDIDQIAFAMMLGAPLIAAATLFPVTLPSVYVSLELVFTFYFVLAYDMATGLWVNFLGELLGGLWLAKKSRKTVIFLNPAIKVVCLMVGYLAYAQLEPLLLAAGMTIGFGVIKLFTVGLVFFLLNHLILNLWLYLHTWQFNLHSCLHAVRWEAIIFLVVFPLAYLGSMMHTHTGAYSLLILSAPVAIIIYLIRGYSEMQWSNLVNQECMKLSVIGDLEAICQRTFLVAQRLTDSTHAVLLKRAEDGTYEGVGADGEAYTGIAHALLSRATEAKEVMAVRRVFATDSIIPGWDTHSLMLVPLVGKAEVFGVIVLTKPSSHRFNVTHQQQLGFLASQVSIILDRNHMYEELERAAITNRLTGLYNYRYFYQRLEQTFHEAVLEHEELCLIIFDIDYFKKYNDLYGHIVGDEVLRQVALIARRTTERCGLLLARYGGEEFVAVGKMTPEEAYRVGEEVRSELERHQFVYQEHTVKNITISVGIAARTMHEAFSPKDLLEKADQALYWGAKEMGRNRVAVYNADFDQKLFVDSVTGLHTVHYLQRKLSSICENAAHLPLYFLHVDICDMHKINEQHGFACGNHVLVDASYILKSAMRADDLICRYQNDEFLVVVKGIPGLDLDGVASRIRNAFAKHPFDAVNRVAVDVSIVTLERTEDKAHVWEWIDAACKRREPDEAVASASGGY